MFCRIIFSLASLACAGLGTFLSVAAVVAAEPEKLEPIKIAGSKHAGPVDFETEVLPILRRNCLACHNATKAESDLILESPTSILKGGGEGPAVIPGKSGESLLLKLASHSKKPVMPPKNNDAKAKSLTPEELGLIQLWIDEGAKGEVRENAPVKWQAVPPRVNPIFAVAISPDGQYAAAGRANQIYMYHVPSLRELGPLTNPNLLASEIYRQPGFAQFDLVQSLAFSPDGSLLAAGGYREATLWRRKLPEKRFALEPNAANIAAVAIRGDGQQFALALENGNINLVNGADGKRLLSLEGHAGPVKAIAFTGDGARLVSGGTDKTLRLWNVADGKQVAMLTTPTEIAALALIEKDARVAVSGGDNAIHILPLPAPDLKWEPGTEPKLDGHSQPPSLLYAVGDTQLISAAADGSARLWNLANHAVIRKFDFDAPIVDLAVHAAAQRVVIAGANGVAKLFHLETAAAVAQLKGDFRAALAVDAKNRELGAAQRIVANAQTDLKQAEERVKKEEEEQTKTDAAKTKAVADFKTKEDAAKKPLAEKEEAEKTLAAANEAVMKANEAAQAAQSAAKAAAESLQKTAAANDPPAKQQAEDANKNAQEALRQANDALNKSKQAQNLAEQKVKQLAGPAQKAIDEKLAAQKAVEAAERSAERSAENIKSAKAAVPLLQATLAQCEQVAKQNEGEVVVLKKADANSQSLPWKTVAFSRNGELVATAGQGLQAFVWSAQTGAPVERIEIEAGANRIHFANDSHALVVARDTAHLWNFASSWQWERTLGAPDKPELLCDRVTALAFSPDAKLLATGGGQPSRSGEVKLWNVENGALARSVPNAHSDTVCALEFSPDGAQLASSAADRFAKIFQVADGKQLLSLEGHTHHVLAVSWQADGRVLATGSADKTVKIWNARTAEQMRTIGGFNKEVTSLSFFRDPARFERICIASGDRSLRIFRTSDGNSETSFDGISDYAGAARISDDGKYLVSGGLDSAFRIWKGENNQPVAVFGPPARSPPPGIQPPAK